MLGTEILAVEMSDTEVAMASPFSTIEAFHAAAESATKGAIYTFAHISTVNHVGLGLSFLLFGWFIFKINRQSDSPSRLHKSLSQLSLAVVSGILFCVHRLSRANR